MKLARLVVFSVSLAAATTAGYVALKMNNNQRDALSATIAQPKVIIEHEKMLHVLVAKRSLPVGAVIAQEDVAWVPWPESAVIEGFLVQSQANQQSVRDEIIGSLARFPILEGEPIRFERLVQGEHDVLSTRVPAGKRAVAVGISNDLAAGGLIMPNDRVDVIMVKEEGNGIKSTFSSEIILSNIRVLAIDRYTSPNPPEQGGQLQARTATLELTKAQAGVVAYAIKSSAALVLALRSLADASQSDETLPESLTATANPSVQLIKGGQLSSVTKSGETMAEGNTVTPPSMPH